MVLSNTYTVQIHVHLSEKWPLLLLFVRTAICYPSISLPLSRVIFCLAPCPHTHKMEGSGEVPIQNSFVALPAPLLLRQLPRAPRGTLSQLYMQMALHLGNDAGMLGLRAYLCKSQPVSQSEHTTQRRPQTQAVISHLQHNPQLAGGRA